MLKKSEIGRSKIHSLEDKYLKFWFSTDPLENAKRVLDNYCSRELLKWAPSMFQRFGKNRTDANIKIVEQALSDSSITSVIDLLHIINNQIGTYEPKSSLFRRMQFICNKIKLPFNINVEKEGFSLSIGSLVYSIDMNDNSYRKN